MLTASGDVSDASGAMLHVADAASSSLTEQPRRVRPCYHASANHSFKIVEDSLDLLVRAGGVLWHHEGLESNGHPLTKSHILR